MDTNRTESNAIESGDEIRSYDPEEQTIDELVVKAVEAVAKGENVEQVLEVMLASLPAREKEQVRKKFGALLAKKNMRQPSGDADIPSRTTLSRIRAALSISTRQMIERISQLVRSRPDIANTIRQAGQSLTQSGVSADRVSVSEADLGQIAPVATRGGQQDRGGGRST